jgi:hypothetical protein
MNSPDNFAFESIIFVAVHLSVFDSRLKGEYGRLMGFGLGLYLNQCLSHGLYHGSVTVRTSPVIACLHSIHSASVHFLFSVIPVINDSHTHSHTTLHTRLTHTLYFLVDCYFDLDFCFVQKTWRASSGIVAKERSGDSADENG